MPALLVVTNRGPSISLDEDGTVRAAGSAGGVAPSLHRALGALGGGEWICAAQSADERTLAAQGGTTPVEGVDVAYVALDELVQRAAGGVIANQTLWYVNHGLYELPHRPVLDRRWHEAWDAYRTFNAAFADRVCQDAPEGATVVVNDYHLALVGTHLAQRRPDLETVFFLHTPFPEPDALRVLPRAVRHELQVSLASFGIAAFHVPRWADAYRRCAAAEGLTVGAATVPLGVDAEGLLALAGSDTVRARRAALRDLLGDRQLVARSDRIELSKNIVRGFLAFGELLEHEPHRRGRVVFAARVYASRTDLAEYLAYANDLHRVVDRINDRFGDAGYTPIELGVADDFDASVALLCENDALLVNPVRDGMNLVAKEGALVNAHDGVLLLSEEAGAFDELGPHAVPIEPFDVSGTARALAAALDMDRDERRRRAAALRAAAPGIGPREWRERVAALARQARV